MVHQVHHVVQHVRHVQVQQQPMPWHQQEALSAITSGPFCNGAPVTSLINTETIWSLALQWKKKEICATDLGEFHSRVLRGPS